MILRFVSGELRYLLASWSVYIPSLFSGLLALLAFTVLFEQAYGQDVAGSVGTGWVMFTANISAVALATVAVIDVNLSRSAYYLHLPLNRAIIAAVKLLSSALVAVSVNAIIFIGAVGLGAIEFNQFPSIFFLNILQSFAVGSLIIIPSLFLNDVTRFSILVTLLVSVLQYLSPMLVPINSFPNYLIPLLYLNPVTPAVAIVRDGAPFLENTAILLALAIAYGTAGILTLRQHLLRKEHRLLR